MGYSLGLLSGPHDPSTQRVPVAPLPSPRTPTRRSRRSNPCLSPCATAKPQLATSAIPSPTGITIFRMFLLLRRVVFALATSQPRSCSRSSTIHRLITRSRSVPDSAIQTSFLRPSIWRASEFGRSLGKLSKLSVSGSKRTIALALHSESHTLSSPSYLGYHQRRRKRRRRKKRRCTKKRR